MQGFPEKYRKRSAEAGLCKAFRKNTASGARKIFAETREGPALLNPDRHGTTFAGGNKKAACRILFLIPFFLWNQVLQVRIVGYALHLVLDYLQHVGLYLRIVAVYLLLHDVVSVRVPELVDDRYFLIGFHLLRHFRAVHDDAGMENLLFYLLPEVVGHAAHESTLREVGDLGGGYEGVHLRVDGCGGVLPVDGEGLPLLEYLAEPLRQALCRLADHLPAEDVAHRVLDDLRLLVPVIPRQLAEVLESETDGHLVAPGGGDQVVNATEVDGGQFTSFTIRLL